MTAELTGAYREIEHAAEDQLLSFLPPPLGTPTARFSTRRTRRTFTRS